jgi:hypothetical protein
MMGCHLACYIFFISLGLHYSLQPLGRAEVADVQTMRPGQALLYGRRLGCCRPRLGVDLGIMPVQEWGGLLFYDQSVLGMKAGQHPRPSHFAQDFLQLLITVLIGKYLTYGRSPGRCQLLDISRTAIEAEVH